MSRVRLTAKGKRWRDNTLIAIGMAVFLVVMGYVGYLEGLS